MEEDIKEDDISLFSKPILYWAWPSSAPACLLYFLFSLLKSITLDFPLEDKKRKGQHLILPLSPLLSSAKFGMPIMVDKKAAWSHNCKLYLDVNLIYFDFI